MTVDRDVTLLKIAGFGAAALGTFLEETATIVGRIHSNVGRFERATMLYLLYCC